MSSLIQFSSQSLADIIPRDTLLWKLKLLRSAAAYANSRLHAVKAEVLLLARFLLTLPVVVLLFFMEK